jgi:excisionase family DNA binding protein
VTSPFKPITREDAAAILSVSLSTLDNMIAAGAMPAPRTIGGSRRKYWHPTLFYAWLDQQLRAEPTAEASPPPQAAASRKATGRPSATPLGLAERARARNAARISAAISDNDAD